MGVRFGEGLTYCITNDAEGRVGLHRLEVEMDILFVCLLKKQFLFSFTGG